MVQFSAALDNMENAVASLSPEPDDIRFRQARRWHAVRLNTVRSSNLSNAVVIVNPGATDPMVEISTTRTSDLVPDYCSNGADTDDDIRVTRGGTFYISMCEVGTGEVEIRDTTSGELLNRYTVSMSSSAPAPAPTPTVAPTATRAPTRVPSAQPTPTPVANACRTTRLSSITQTWNGRWSTYDCQSDYRPAGRYSDFYLIRPTEDATVTIGLESSIDTYLVLYKNGTSDAHYVAHNDDRPSGGLNSRLTHDMEARNDYYIEATTYWDYRTGSYRLRITFD